MELFFHRHACHSLEGRINLLTQGCLISPMWRDLDADQKASFRREHHHLQQAALADKLTITMVQHIVTKDTSWTGSRGQHYPISWYTIQGYDVAVLVSTSNRAVGWKRCRWLCLGPEQIKLHGER